MKALRTAWMLFTLGWLAAIVFGCGASHSHPGSTIVPISSFDKVAGNWEGVSKRVPDMQDHAYVLVSIGTNGRFTFVTDRGTQILLGTGTLTAIEGKLFGQTSSGSGTFTLHDRAGNPALVVTVVLNDGNHYYLEMTPVR